MSAAADSGKSGAGLKLWASPTSPYVRKVRVLALEAGLDGIELVAGSATPVDPGVPPAAGHNPLGKIPVLLTQNGEALFDSRVITRWLDAHVGSGFYPEGAALWPVLTLEALADGILDAALLMVYETRLRPEELYFAPWAEGQWRKIMRTLDLIETARMPELAGALTAAQIALAVALGYLDFRHAARNWREGHPHLAAWAAVFAARPAMLATAPVA